MNADLISFARMDVDRVRAAVHFLEQYGLSPDQIRARMNADLRGLADMDVDRVRAAVHFLERYGLSPDQIRARMNADLQSFAALDHNALSAVLSIMTREGLTPVEIRTFMNQSMTPFANFDPARLERVLDSLKAHGFEAADIRDLFLTNIHGLSRATSEELANAFNGGDTGRTNTLRLIRNLLGQIGTRTNGNGSGGGGLPLNPHRSLPPTYLQTQFFRRGRGFSCGDLLIAIGTQIFP